MTVLYIHLYAEVFFFLKIFNFRITEMSYVDVWKVSSLRFVCLSNMCVDFLEWYLVWMCRFASPDGFVACGQWTVTDVCVCVCVRECLEGILNLSTMHEKLLGSGPAGTQLSIYLIWIVEWSYEVWNVKAKMFWLPPYTVAINFHQPPRRYGRSVCLSIEMVFCNLV